MHTLRLAIRRAVVAAVALSFAVAARPAEAQQAAGGALPRRHALTINPLGIPFEYISAEYEGVVAPSFTVGGNLSWAGLIDDGDYASLELKGRLYPGEQAPRGFSVGLGFGLTRVSGRPALCVDDCGDRTHTSPAVHVFVDHNWLLGPTRRFFVGAGLGAKRLFGDIDDELDDILVVYPTARFQIGVHW